MTRAGAATVYKGARCYFSEGKQCFRCVLNAAVNPSDVPFSWAQGRAAAWKRMLDWIDNNK